MSNDLSPATRAKLGRLAFVQAPPVIGCIQMRPLTAGTADLCAEQGITFIKDMKVLADAGEDEAQRQVFLFLFIHGYRDKANQGDEEKDINSMLQAVWTPDREEFRRRFLIPFSMAFPMEAIIPGIMDWLSDINQKTQAALFSLAEKPPICEDAPPPPVPPPN